MKKIILRQDVIDPWEHLLILDEHNNLISDSLENHRLSTAEVLAELAKYDIIKLEIEEIID